MAKKRKLENKSETEQKDDQVIEEEEENQETLVAATSAEPETLNADEDDEEDDDDDDDPEEEEEEEPVKNLLEPFTKDQLIDLLREAAENHSDVLDAIKNIADIDPAHRKIFVHGLGWDANVETLINAFNKYGEIEDCKCVSDKVSGKSKGYGFILFKHRNGARKALKQPQKRIGNRMTACQLASAGPVPSSASAPAPAPVTVSAPAAPPVSEYTQRKIYVSNVSADVDPQKLLEFFSKYGEIVEGPLGLDKQTGKPKGFTLFVYKTIESAKKALEEQHKNFEGHVLHCQKAIDGPKSNKQHRYPTRASRGSRFPRSGNPMTVAASSEMGVGNTMTPPSNVSFNQAASQLNPVLGQALTALLATQGSGLGLTNLLGSLGATGVGAPMSHSAPSVVNNVPHVMQGGYGNQYFGSNTNPRVYGNQPGTQVGYSNPQTGKTNSARSQQGVGYMSGVAPYMGR